MKLLRKDRAAEHDSGLSWQPETWYIDISTLAYQTLEV